MKRWTLFIALGVAAIAAEEKKPDPPKPISEVHRLKIENLSLKQRLTRETMEKLAVEQNALIEQVCKEAGLDKANCAIDGDTWTVRSLAADAAKAPDAGAKKK